MVHRGQTDMRDSIHIDIVTSGLFLVCSTAVIGGALIGLTGGMATPAVGKHQDLNISVSYIVDVPL